MIKTAKEMKEISEKNIEIAKEKDNDLRKEIIEDSKVLAITDAIYVLENNIPEEPSYNYVYCTRLDVYWCCRDRLDVDVYYNEFKSFCNKYGYNTRLESKKKIYNL